MKYCEFCKTVETHKRFCSERCRSGWRRANGVDRGNPNNPKKPATPKPALVIPDVEAQANSNIELVTPPSIFRSPEPIEIETAPKGEACYFDECTRPMDESIIIEHPDLKRLHLTLRVSLCSKHKYLLKEVA